MSRLTLETDEPDQIVLQAPRGGAIVLAALALVAVVGVRWVFPGALIAQAMLALFALGALASLLRRHRLTLDLTRRTFCYRRGWWFSPALRAGSLDEGARVVLDHNEADGGLEAGRLRSRRIRLELGEEEGSFPLGFPMGPRIAEEKAADYARRLGVELVDRVGETVDH
ncbi:MAG: hypothetical protein GY719_28720 [bacterium]|nr:hypothetical protein [bacterium]